MSPRTLFQIALAASVCSAATSASAADAPVEKVSVRAIAHYDFDRATIRAEDQAAILAEVSQMKGVTWQSVTATGHTDSIGPVDYNAKLSAKRAGAVKSFLVGKGLDPAMIKTQAKAAEAPVADNSSDNGRSKNRRAEIVFQGVRASAEAAPR